MPEIYDLTALAASLTAAYAAGNRFPASALPDVLTAVHGALCGLGQGSRPLPVQPARSSTDVRRSITPDALISFLDGRPYRTLKRHLTAHGLDPHGYRTRFGLPSDYPMVAPGYAARRSEIAKAMQLGVPGRAALQAAE